MAKKPAAKSTVEALFQAAFQHEKDTKNKNRFKEDVAAGQQELIGSLYMMRSFMSNATRVTLTAVAGDDSSETDLEGQSVAFKFRNETKNKVRFEEVVAKGAAGVIETLYVNKAAFDGDVPDVIVVKLEG